MAAEPTDVRMSRLEGAYEQLSERMGAIESRLGALEQRVSAEVAILRTEVRSDIGDLRRQMTTQFYWVLTFILGSILIPILRETIH